MFYWWVYISDSIYIKNGTNHNILIKNEIPINAPTRVVAELLIDAITLRANLLWRPEDWIANAKINPPKNIEDIYDSLKKDNPKGCYAVKTMSKEYSLDEWYKMGFNNIDGKKFNDGKIMARLVAPDGIDGRMFLVYRNYKTILYYNCSHYYALSVGILSDNFK